MIKYKYSKIYWFFRNFEFLKVYFSPFKLFLPKLYVGKIAVGTPYFLPRVWKNVTPKKAVELTLKEMGEVKKYNEKEQTYKRTVKTFDELYEQKLNSSFAQPKKIGFNFVNLGWKTKWGDDDFRHEWNPVWSFVCFGYQIALIFIPENSSHYWESYLFYHYATDKDKSVKERVEYARKEFPSIWTSHSDEGKVTTNYWDASLKNKYLK